jgi:hypothetical protein
VPAFGRDSVGVVLGVVWKWHAGALLDQHPGVRAREVVQQGRSTDVALLPYRTMPRHTARAGENTQQVRKQLIGFATAGTACAILVRVAASP